MSPNHRAEPEGAEVTADRAAAEAPGAPDQLDVLVDRLADEQAALETASDDDAFGTLPGDRPEPPAVAGEMETLQGFLDVQRATVVRKVTGLSDEQAARRLVGSATTVTGVVRHLATSERFWFCQIVGGVPPEEVGYTRYEQSGPHGEWAVAQGASLEAALTDYAAAIDLSRSQLHGRDPDEELHAGEHLRSLRWVLIHMVEETARHAGQLDVLAELLDGRTGE
ncbi:DinB family protein [Brachybacterium sacelli]|uniref:Damage-inducible protein DinB n=1 Tax=Brachybacterium sacelli TaxID=173364 RepID=A0ABS4X0C2_9MICO|nr:DinB family protein [Brachybacterium sacelli]MBP2381905.1 putative damage-inducible protein DinB [Brachybacterium sacelli]